MSGYLRAPFTAKAPMTNNRGVDFDNSPDLELRGKIVELTTEDVASYDLKSVKDTISVTVFRNAVTQVVGVDWRLEVYGQNYKVEKVESSLRDRELSYIAQRE